MYIARNRTVHKEFGGVGGLETNVEDEEEGKDVCVCLSAQTEKIMLLAILEQPHIRNVSGIQ